MSPIQASEAVTQRNSIVRSSVPPGTYIRVNGRGNAWPLDLRPTDTQNLRHNELFKQFSEYSNTSFSILIESKDAAEPQARVHLLLDVGQGIVPFLVQQEDGFPDALIVSHPHFDHIAGLDWLVQTYARYRPESKLPIYTSRPCWDAIIAHHFSYLGDKIDPHYLLPGERLKVRGIEITGYPVFHGDFAPGAMMILLNFVDGSKALFTGDLMCPLLRPQDWTEICGVDVVCVDANTRFPYPRSGHWSIVNHDPKKRGLSSKLNDWTEGKHPSYLITPHSRGFEKRTHDYLDEFLRQGLQYQTPCWSIFEFVRLIEPKQVQLVHYSGYEDHQHHDGQEIMTDPVLLEWTEQEWAVFAPMPRIAWNVPKPGDIIRL